MPNSQTSQDQDLRTALHKAVSKALHDNQFADGWPEMVDPVVDAVMAIAAPPRPVDAERVGPSMLADPAVKAQIRQNAADMRVVKDAAHSPDKAVTREGVETWGVEYTGDAIWVGTMRPDGGKVDRVIYFKDDLGLHRPEYVAQVKADARLICDSVNAALAPKPTGTEAGRGVGAEYPQRLRSSDQLRIISGYHSDKLPVGIGQELCDLADEWDDQVDELRFAATATPPVSPTPDSTGGHLP
jgi:hypothetical protein